MFYKFPNINHIDDIRPAIEGRPEFVIAERDGYKVVNYLVAMEDTFPPVKTAGGSAKMREEQTRIKAIRRELRGIIFDEHGYILSRRLHKFFNVNERDETNIKHIDLSQPHDILEKLDGSMITPIYIRGAMRWGTKMGVTDVAKPVEEFVVNHPTYEQFAWHCHNLSITPIFEWCSRKQRIVVDYPEDRLVLIAIRNNYTGDYIDYNDMKRTASAWNIDVVKAYQGKPETMQKLIDETKNIENAEGWVLRFYNGHMFKIKGDWYLRIHKTKDNLTHEKNILDLIVNETIDDAKSFMLEDDRKKVEKYEKDFWKGFNETASNVINTFLDMKKTHKGDKKSFAIKDASLLPKHVRSIIFSVWDEPNTFEAVNKELLSMIRRNIGSQSKVDSVRYIWGEAKWDYSCEE